MLESEFEKRIEAELRAIRAFMSQGVPLTPRVVTRAQAATLLNVSVKHIARMVARGDLLQVDVGGALRIPKSEIERFEKPLVAKSNRGNPETERRVRFDGAKALAELNALHAKNQKKRSAKPTKPD